MLRGIQKRMIVCKPSPTSRFECAYFVLRDKGEIKPQEKEDTMREIRRMLSDGERQANRGSKKLGSREHRRRLWIFFGGVLCGALPLLLLLLLS